MALPCRPRQSLSTCAQPHRFLDGVDCCAIAPAFDVVPSRCASRFSNNRFARRALYTVVCFSLRCVLFSIDDRPFCFVAYPTPSAFATRRRRTQGKINTVIHSASFDAVPWTGGRETNRGSIQWRRSRDW